jgi:hypothetical protein
MHDTPMGHDDETVEVPSRRLFLGRLATLAAGTALVTALPVSSALADDDDWFPGRRLGQRLRREFDRASRASQRAVSSRRRDDDDDDDRGSRGRGRGRGRDDDDDDDDGGRGGRGGRGEGRGGRGGGDDDGDDD